MPQALRILLVEHNLKDAELVLGELRRAGFEPDWHRVDTEAAYLERLNDRIDLVISDYDLPKFSGPRALELLRQRGLDVPFIFASGTVGEDTAVAVMKLGAADYLLKDRLARLGPAVNQALEQCRRQRERQQAESTLQAKQAQLAEALRITHLAYWEYDALNDRFHFNDQFYAILRTTAAREGGYIMPAMQYARRFVHPDDGAIVGTEIQKALTTTDPNFSQELSHRIVYADGEVGFFTVHVRIQKDAQGRTVRTYGASMDVTARKQAEEALRASEERFRQLAENIRAVYWITDVEKKVMIYISPTYETIWGRTCASLLASPKAWFEAIFPEDRERVAAALPKQAEGTYDEEYRIRRPDGSFRWIRERAFPVPNAAGEIYRIAGVAEDITERTRAEEALAVERTLLRTLFNLLPDYIYVKDTQSRFITCNDWCARGMGAGTPQEVIGKTDAEFYPADVAARFRADELAVLQGTALIDKEEMIIRADGTRQFILTTKLPLKDDQGRITGIVGDGRDITERKNLEEQFRQSQKMEAIGQLSGGVAHDFNNLLTVIKGHVGLLRIKGQVSPDIAESIFQIDGAADRAAKLTMQLLTFSRQQVMQPTALNLNALVFNLTKMLRRLLSESIEIEVECAPQPLPIQADEGMVEQLLLNLAVNARDAMPKTGTLRIKTEPVDLDEPAARRMALARPGAFVCLAISDTGTGIAPDVLPHIFEPFFTTKEVGKGTGLGLATAYGIMQQHGGWVTVESVVGRGTVFRMYFPRLASAPLETLAGPAHAPVRGQLEGILLVEDEPAVRKVAEAALTGFGYRVFSAPSGLAALQVWATHKNEIQLLLTDLVMPDGVNGRDLALRLRDSNPGLPVVYMSGYSHEVAAGDFPLQEGKNYLAKPFDLTRLARIVRASLDTGVTTAPFAGPSG